MKNIDIREELARIWSWGFDPRTPLKDLTVRGWEKFQSKTLAAGRVKKEVGR